jgi:hypothetical protein
LKIFENMKWSWGPLVSLSHRLNDSRRSLACDTMSGDVMVTVHRRSSPIHMGHSSLSRTWVHRDSSPTSLLPPHACSLLLLSALSPSICSPSSAAVKPTHRRPCGSIAPLSSVEGTTTLSSSNQRLMTPATTFPHR